MEKYYTPAIEDIHVGYECETRQESGEWKKLTVTTSIGFHKWQLPTLRTPYLTKEQIEAEGWIFEPPVDGIKLASRPDFILKKNDTLTYNLYIRDKRISIELYTKRTGVWEMSSWVTIYSGSCPSINEFRTICKLLNIK